jgi:signal peptidase
MKIKEPYSTVLYIVFGVLLAFGINNGLALALSTDLPVVAVESRSMEPVFTRGDILGLRGQPSYEIGDIIVFSHGNGKIPIVHRIIAINPDGTYQTKGDANSNQLPVEKSISLDQIHGKVIVIIPYLGWIKIGMGEFILPNILWIAGAVILLYLILAGAVKSRR